MIALLLSFICIFSISVLSGNLIIYLLKWKSDLFDSFFLGFAITNSVFTICSLFIPITAFLIAILGFVILIILLCYKEWTIQFFAGTIEQIRHQFYHHPIFSLSAFIWCSVAFLLSLYSPQLNPDAGLYHIQAIKWVAEYPVIPGLANLHDRLGFNPNIFTLFAGTNLSLLFKQPIYSLNYTLVAVFSCWVIYNSQKYYLKKKYLFAFCHILILYFICVYLFKWISTTTPDYGAIILILYGLFKFTEIDDGNDNAVLVFILSIYAVTLKLFSIPILVLALYIILYNKFNNIKKDITTMLIISSIILVPWFIRNVILTGWIIFPFPYFDFFSIDWKVPIEEVRKTQITISNWARIPGISQPDYIYKFSFWFPIWIKNHDVSELIFIVVTLITSTLSLTLTLTKSIISNKYSVVAIITAMIGIFFWFFTAPDFRFGIFYFIPALFLPFKTFDVSHYFSRSHFLVMSLLFSIYFIHREWRHPWFFLRNYSQYYLLPQKVDSIAHNKGWAFSYFLIDDRIKCYFPLYNPLCFDKELPCTIELKNNLHLRGIDIRDGFCITKRVLTKNK